jgi:hypothetical protein
MRGAAGLGRSDGKLMARPSRHQARPGLMGTMAAMIDKDMYSRDLVDNTADCEGN